MINFMKITHESFFVNKTMYEKWKCVYYPEGGDKDDCVG